ncbi:MAG TPA: hypothetical protein VGN34_25435 [Ktedonobacteraceae bacterium]|jgi:hypothetical protein
MMECGDQAEACKNDGKPAAQGTKGEECLVGDVSGQALFYGGRFFVALS